MADRFGYGEIGLGIHPCRGCEDYDAPDGCKSNGGCGRTQTNADRIRAMTDEELAYFIAEPSVAPPPWCKEIPVCPHLDEDIVPCHECAIDWLRQEAKDA